jgi:hypothetical protein
MNERGKKMSLPSHGGPRSIRAELEKLAIDDSKLSQSLEAALADESLEQKSLAQAVQAHSAAMHRRVSLILRWMDQIDSRMNEMQSRLSDLANHASDQDETMTMMCSVLKDMDDPFGFGRTLDERILGDADTSSPDRADD